MSEPTLRYVVLHHTGIEHPHFDLMLETSNDGPLATWRLPHWPPQKGDVPLRIGDHRREYLEYEGSLSGNRGGVKRVAAGLYSKVRCDAATIQIRFDIAVELELPNE